MTASSDLLLSFAGDHRWPHPFSVTSITLVWSPHSGNWAFARMIDALLPKPAFPRSHGEALVAMIVNGLGFHSSTLHMFPTSSS